MAIGYAREDERAARPTSDLTGQMAPGDTTVGSTPNLVVAAITLWNTIYLECAVTLLRKSQTVETGLLQHVSPLGWEHVGLTGDYLWHSDKRVAKGGFRPLRTPGTSLGGP